MCRTYIMDWMLAMLPVHLSLPNEMIRRQSRVSQFPIYFTFLNNWRYLFCWDSNDWTCFGCVMCYVTTSNEFYYFQLIRIWFRRVFPHIVTFFLALHRKENSEECVVCAKSHKINLFWKWVWLKVANKSEEIFHSQKLMFIFIRLKAHLERFTCKHQRAFGYRQCFHCNSHFHT